MITAYGIRHHHWINSLFDKLCEAIHADRRLPVFDVHIQTGSGDSHVCEIRSLGLRLQKNAVNEWQLWCYIYFNKTETIYEGQLSNDIRVFKTLNEIKTWCSRPSSVEEVKNRFYAIFTDYHEYTWKILSSMKNDDPVDCYEVWYMDFSPFDEYPWLRCESFNSYEEAHEFVFDELKKWETNYGSDKISSFAYYFIYALSKKDKRCRALSVKRFSDDIKRQLCEVRQSEYSLKPVISDLCEQVLDNIEGDAHNNESFNVSSPLFCSEICIAHNSGAYEVKVSLKISDIPRFSSNYRFDDLFEVEDWLKKSRKTLASTLIENISLSLNDYLDIG